jgi:SAM-dependent methyltransferase
VKYFAPKSAAERYAKGRPYFHPLVVDRIKAYLSLKAPVARAIDVGCGTGLSTVALEPIAQRITGVDESEEMIALAPAHRRIDYCVAPAERPPFKDDTFDLMTLGSAFHWLDRGAFLAAARRVLRAHGRLVVYDHYFLAQMRENPAYQDWAREVFLARYPTPARAPVGFDERESAGEGFQLLGQEGYQNVVEFTVGSLVDYLVTQSNVIAVVEGGGERIDSVRGWLTDNITPLFGGRVRAGFLFAGPIWYLRRAP